MRLYSDTSVTGSMAGAASRTDTFGVEVVRSGHIEPFLKFPPGLSSNAAHWGGIKLENYSVPAVMIPRHEHPEHFLHLVLKGSVN
jgi:AraC family transcriptional regulator